MRPEAGKLLERSERALHAAEVPLEAGDAENALGRA